MKHSYTKEEFEAAVNSSVSVREALTKLGIANKGGNYGVFYRHAKRHGVCIEHFKGAAWAKGKTFAPKDDISVYLSNAKPIGSYRLKQRLLTEGIMKAMCVRCTGTHWLGQPMPLELDHIDGDSQNNQLENLRLLCPNCHSFTTTYRGKNQKRCK